MDDVRARPDGPGSQGSAPEPAAQSQPIGADPSRDWLITSTNARGERLRPGDYVSDWEEGEYPFGALTSCPFCKEKQNYTELWYNGPGSPPSYSVICGSCSAQGPTSQGRFKGDHFGACLDAVAEWNRAQTSPSPNPHGDRE